MPSESTIQKCHHHSRYLPRWRPGYDKCSTENLTCICSESGLTRVVNVDFRGHLAFGFWRQLDGCHGHFVMTATTWHHSAQQD